MNPCHYDLAHEKLTDYLLQFCLSRIQGMDNAASDTPETFGTNTGFVSIELACDREVLQAGDLLLISGHRKPAWRMAWLKQVRVGNRGTEYLVKSTQGEGEVTWLDNVSVSFFHRPTLEQHPEWRWNNEKHHFADRWMESVTQSRDTRLIAPVMPVFFGDSVQLKARGRFGICDFKPSIMIHDFRSLTHESVLGCFDELCQQMDTHQVLKKEVIN